VFRRFAFGGLSPFAAVLFCTALGLALQNYFKYVIAIVLVSMVIGVALVVLVGLARCITLATGAVMAIGAYTSTLLMTRIGIPYLIGLFCAAATGALAGWLIALPGTRFRGHNLAMVTLVFQAVAIILLREAKWLTGGAEGIHVPQPVIFGWRVATDADFLVLIGLLSALVILLVTILTRGPFGKNLQAASGNEIAAEAFGVSVPAYLRAAFVISSMVIGFSGALAAPRIRILDPESFGVLPSIFMLAYPIVGGMQSVWGGLLGGGGLLERRGETEDRAGRRSADRLVRVFPRELGRAPHFGDAGGLLSRERFLQTADDLREDHAAVSARAHQGAVRRRGAHLVDLRLGLARVLYRGAHGVKHVRAGIAVGDGVDVEPVDGLPVGSERVAVGRDHGFEVVWAQALERGHRGRC